MDKLTPKETSKGAEEIVLTQIKQDFITPANAIFDYVDMVEKVLNDLELVSEDEISQIKSSCSKPLCHIVPSFLQPFVPPCFVYLFLSLPTCAVSKGL